MGGGWRGRLVFGRKEIVGEAARWPAERKGKCSSVDGSMMSSVVAERRGSREENGIPNLAFDPNPESGGTVVEVSEGKQNGHHIGPARSPSLEANRDGSNLPKRQEWDKPVEFLLSCIAMSVGLGNLWRFPFTAYDNGGGAFLIPYIVVLFIIGKPLYYLEIAIGQFSNSGPVKVWEVVPALRGIGVGQSISVGCALSYYCSLTALATFYFFASFSNELPWSTCDPSWNDCFDSKPRNLAEDVGNLTMSSNISGMKHSSSELYFLRYVLNQKDDIEDGIGLPDWRLTLCLLFSWVSIFLVFMKGVQSAGKASYFLALFPYVVMITLLIRGVTLPGAIDGILFFISPRWAELLNPKVWYSAVTQCFFSLNVSFGTVIYSSSFNNFKHNFHRDVIIVTTLDTCTSLLAGFTIFSILGNLAYESGMKDIASVVQGGTGLAFISYPDAIAKFDAVPQLFSVLFFLMLYTLAIGSTVPLTGSFVTTIRDYYPKTKLWVVTLFVCVIGFLCGLVYITPGGMFVLTLVDYYGASFVVFILSAIEVMAINWIYGLENFCQDINFVLNRKLNTYWRLCWGILTPVLLLTIFMYSVFNLKPVTYGGIEMPPIAHTMGWILMAFGAMQLPLWVAIEFYKQRGKPFSQIVKSSFTPSFQWGPRSHKDREEWHKFKSEQAAEYYKEKNGGRRLMKSLLGFDMSYRISSVLGRRKIHTINGSRS
ncbi:sodium-dependent nutrient amino acid transporter 1-like [Ischnura elegans]|uniref:sodium-dependent nutrient amino acid transporter 1-like n=1 Tax=Ischnura elegans TaxID=197161 RepID=UPI001ED8A098|nr:sodium-dependent nutrient amino acid transporter 1-like [Ischnura elegans]